MSVAYRAVGGGTGGTSAITFSGAALPTCSVGDMLIALIGWGNDTDTQLTKPGAWNALPDQIGGTGTYGTDTGSRHLTWYWKIADAADAAGTSSHAWSNTGGTAATRVVWGYITSYTKTGPRWHTPIVSSGADNDLASNYSAACSTDPGAGAGDIAVLAAATIPVATNPTLTESWAGITSATSPITTGSSSSGARVRVNVRYVTPTALQLSTAAPTIAGSVQVSGPAGMLRLRDAPVPWTGDGNADGTALTTTTLFNTGGEAASGKFVVRAISGTSQYTKRNHGFETTATTASDILRADTGPSFGPGLRVLFLKCVETWRQATPGTITSGAEQTLAAYVTGGVRAAAATVRFDGRFSCWNTAGTQLSQSGAVLVVGHRYQRDLVVAINPGTPTTTNGRVITRVTDLDDPTWNGTGKYYYDSGYTTNVNTATGMQQQQGGRIGKQSSSATIESGTPTLWEYFQWDESQGDISAYTSQAAVEALMDSILPPSYVVPYPAFRDSNTVQANATTVVSTIPTTAQVGDVAFAVVGWGNTQTMTPPSGWTQFVSPIDNGVTETAAAYYKVLASADIGATFTWGNSGVSKITVDTVIYSGVDNSNPVAAVGTNYGSSSGTSRNGPTYTNPGVLQVGAMMTRGTSPSAWTPPSGFTLRSSNVQSGGGSNSTAIADSTTDLVSSDDVWTSTVSMGQFTTIYWTPRAVTSGYTGSASLSGSGSLAASALPSLSSAALLSGSGSLNAGGTPNPNSAAALSGSGSLSGSGTPSSTGLASLSGSGTLGATATPAATGAGSLNGSGVLTSTATPVTSGSGALSGSGSLSASATPSTSSSGSLSGSGTLTATSTSSSSGSSSLSGNGTLTATGTKSTSASGSLSGVGSLTAAGTPRPTQAASLSGSGTLSATGSASSAATGSGQLSGSGQLGQVVVNLVDDPRATSYAFPAGKYIGPYNNRWGAYVTYSLVSGASDGPVVDANGTKLTTYSRQTVTTSRTGLGFHLPDNVEAANPIGQPYDIPISTGDMLWISVFWRASVDCTPQMTVRGALGTAWSTSSAATAFGVKTGGTWNRLAIPVGPTSAASDGLAVHVTTGTALPVGTTIDVTGYMVTKTSWLTDYFDPTTVPTWTWDGTVNGSKSRGGIVGASASIPGGGNLSGSGSLVASGIPSLNSGASLSGSGSLSATATLSASSSASLSGSGSLSASGTPSTAASGSLSGSGTLTATGTGSSNASGSASLSGSGTLTSSGTPSVARAVSLSGSGTLTASGIPSVARAASLSGSGTLTAVATPATAGGASLSGSGSLSATGTGVQTGSVNLSGVGSLSATAIPSVTRTPSLSGTGTLSTQGKPTLAGPASLNGSGTLTATGTKASTGNASLSGSGALTASAIASLLVPVSFSGSGTLTAAGQPAINKAAALSGTGTLTAAGKMATTGGANLSGTGTLSGTGKFGAIGAASLSGSGQLDATGFSQFITSGMLSGSGQLIASGIAVINPFGPRLWLGTQLVGLDSITWWTGTQEIQLQSAKLWDGTAEIDLVWY